MFVTALFEQAVEPDALLVPQQAVQRDFDGSAFVYLVGKDDKLARRKVVTTPTAGTDCAVSSGLPAGDRALPQVTGTLTPGVAVEPLPAHPPHTLGPAASRPANDPTRPLSPT